MRVVTAILISGLLLSGTWAYTNFSDSIRREPVQIQAQMDDASWRITLVRTFDCVPDSDSDIASLNVQFKGEDVFKSAETIAADAVVEITDVPEVEQGENELFIAANLATLNDFNFKSEQNALRVQIFRSDKLIKDETIWSEPGATAIEDTVLFQAPEVTDGPTHDHD